MSSWPEPSAHDPRQLAPYAETWIYLPPAHRSSTAHLVIAWLGTVLSAGYLLPWAVGATRNRTNAVAIALVNILLGWTLVGWVIALVMACGSERQQPVAIRTVPGTPFALPAEGPYHPLSYDHSPYDHSPFERVPHGRSADARQHALTGPTDVHAPEPTYPLYPVGPPTAAEATVPLPPYGSRSDLR